MNEQNYQTPFRRRSGAADFRKRSRDSLNGRWGIAIGVMFLFMLLRGAGSGGVKEIFPSPFPSPKFDFTDLEDLSRWVRSLLDQIFSARFFVLSLVSSLAGLVFNCFVMSPLQVGYSKFRLDLIDGNQKTGVATLFAPFGSCYLKAVGVNALLLLIPLAAEVIYFGVVILLVFLESSIGRDPVGIHAVFVLLYMVAGIGISVASVVISYQYRLANYIVSEHPEMDVIDILRNSRLLMRGNKWRLFCLDISFIGWLLLACCTCGIGLIWLIPYMGNADAAFYDELSQRSTAKEVEFPSINPEDYFPQ